MTEENAQPEQDTPAEILSLALWVLVPRLSPSLGAALRVGGSLVTYPSKSTAELALVKFIPPDRQADYVPRPVEVRLLRG